ncbi:MAG: hypothetical protein JWP63_6133 [Candidatus Solibacter sp.]|jgi:hypothetical protein|nr:hypothetical protein [Candidatus Solibacter sp.]
MEQILERLRSGREQYLAALAGIPEERASVKPPADGWSILECAEHVAVVELGLFRRITSQSTVLREETGRHREALYIAHALDRSRKLAAPEPARPSGRFTTLGEAAEAFGKHRDRTILWVETCGENLRLRSLEHPALGTMNVYECLILMAMHPLRHLQQMRELV